MMDVGVLLGSLGIRATHKGSKWVATCPNPKHADTSPSWSIVDRPGDRRHASHHCFSCGWGGGPWELAGAVWGLGVEAAGARLREMGLGGPPPMPKEIPKVVIARSRDPVEFKLPMGVEIPGSGGRWFGPALEYLLARGVTPDQIDRWGLGYATRGRLRFRVVIPVYDGGGRLLTYSARAFSSAAGGGRYDTGTVDMGAKPRRAIWGEAGFTGLEVVTVAEGCFSALALERAGAPNPAAMLGSELTEDKALILGRFRRVLVATDPDAAGAKVAEALAVLGRRARIHRIDLTKSPDDCDPSELRQKIDSALSILFDSRDCEAHN